MWRWTTRAMPGFWTRPARGDQSRRASGLRRLARLFAVPRTREEVPMAGGIFALLDDVAALARIAAASVDDVGAAAGRASAKAAGVVVDDTAVTPQYLHGSA